MKLKSKLIIPIFIIVALAILITWIIVYFTILTYTAGTWAISKELEQIANKVIILYALSAMSVFLPVYFSISISVRRVIEPLTRLKEVSEEIEKWNLQINMNEAWTQDEVGKVAGAFKKMVYKLRKVDEEIKEQVIKQTEEIVEQKEKIQSFNIELQKFKQAVQNASDYITILDSNMLTIYVNNSFKEDLWYSDKDVIGKNPFNSWRQEENYSRFKEIWEKLKNTKDPLTVECNTIKSDKSVFVSRVHITPILNDEDEIIYYLLVEHDVTKEKEIENVKNEFVSIASHELRTPMTVINWFVSVLLQEKFWNLTEEQKNYLFRIQENTTRLINIVNDMLNISRLESNKLELKSEEFDISELIIDIVWSFQILWKNKWLEVLCETFPLNIVSDKEKLRQVFINLTWNALKFTEKWSIKIILEKKEESFKVSIIDTWIGISKDNLSKLFTKFSQIDSALQRKVDWTWLWLAFSKLLIEKMWGSIWVESELWEWSTFWFSLPLMKVLNN